MTGKAQPSTLFCPQSRADEVAIIARYAGRGQGSTDTWYMHFIHSVLWVLQGKIELPEQCAMLHRIMLIAVGLVYPTERLRSLFRYVQFHAYVDSVERAKSPRIEEFHTVSFLLIPLAIPYIFSRWATLSATLSAKLQLVKSIPSVKQTMKPFSMCVANGSNATGQIWWERLRGLVWILPENERKSLLCSSS